MKTATSPEVQYSKYNGAKPWIVLDRGRLTPSGIFPQLGSFRTEREAQAFARSLTG